MPATDGPDIATKSSGTITLYNTYATTGQRLIAGTRFEGNNNLVYHLTSSVIIPGYTKSNNSINPGTIRANIVAERAGSEYNLRKIDFTSTLKIVAYDGGPRYDTIYAKLYTDLTGGYMGTKKTVKSAELASTTEVLGSDLLKELKKQASALVPAEYVTFDNAYTFSHTPPIVAGETVNKATITVSGTLYSIIIKKSDLIAKLAGSQNIDRFGKGSYTTLGLDTLRFLISNPGTFQPNKSNVMIARLNGNIELRGIIPIDELKHKLAGLTLIETQPVFASYNSVINTNKSFGELFPSWALRVPQDENRITLFIKD